MAIINPTLCKNASIQIEVEQRNEGPIPHCMCIWIKLEVVETYGQTVPFTYDEEMYPVMLEYSNL